jgi:hypothetical protein
MARALQGAALGALGALAAWVAGASLTAFPGGRDSRKLIDEIAKLRRDTHALAEALADAKSGTFIGPEDTVVGISEKAVAALFEATLPIEQSLPGLLGAASVTVRIDRVSVLFDGGFGTVRVDGEAWFTHLRDVAAEAHLSGGFSEARIDPLRHELEARVSIDTLEARPLPGGLLAKVLRGSLLRRLNAQAKEAITRALPQVKLPVKVGQELRIPTVNADPVHLQGGSLPVDVSLTRVFASNGRLWLALRPHLGEWHRDPTPP